MYIVQVWSHVQVVFFYLRSLQDPPPPVNIKNWQIGDRIIVIRDNSDNYILDSYKQTKIEAQLGYLMGGRGLCFWRSIL